METPSEKLAAKILDRLVKEGLIRESKRAMLLAKLANGTLRGDDWRAEVDYSQRAEDKDE